LNKSAAGNVAKTEVTSKPPEAYAFSGDELPSDRIFHESHQVDVSWSAKRHRRKAQTTCSLSGVRQRSR